MAGGLKLSGLLWAALPIIAVPLLAAVAANVLQFGLLFTGEAVRPKINRVSPGTGIRRIFSGRTAVRLALDVAKIVAVALVGWLVIAALLPRIVAMATGGTSDILEQTGAMTLGMAIRVLAVLGLVAVVDLVYQRRQHRRDLKITRRELLDDLRRMERNPQTARRMRAAARELSMHRGSSELSLATLVIAGRFGPAVALRYEDDMSVPKVVAIGTGALAARVRRAAVDGGLPVAGNRKLATALIRACRAGQDIPESLYDEVAAAVAGVTDRPEPNAEDAEQ